MKFCTKCGTQLQDDEFFCTNCGNQAPIPNVQEKVSSQSNNNQTPNKSPEFNSQKLQRELKQPYAPKQTESKFNKLINVFECKNIGEKCRKTAKTISTINKVLFVILLALACLLLVISLFASIQMFFRYLFLCAILIPLIYLLTILWQIPIWKLYAFGDIYDSLCNQKPDTKNTTKNNNN